MITIALVLSCLAEFPQGSEVNGQCSDGLCGNSEHVTLLQLHIQNEMTKQAVGQQVSGHAHLVHRQGTGKAIATPDDFDFFLRTGAVPAAARNRFLRFESNRSEVLHLQLKASSSAHHVECSAEETDSRYRVPCIQHVSFLGGAKCGSTLVWDLLTSNFPMLFHPSHGKEKCSFMQRWWEKNPSTISACSAEEYRISYNLSNGHDICKETGGKVKLTLDGCPVYGYWDSPQQSTAFRRSECAFGNDHMKWLFLVRDPVHKLISSWNYNPHRADDINEFVREVLEGKQESSVRRVQYDKILKMALDYVPSNRIHLVSNEDLSQAETFNSMLEFLASGRNWDTSAFPKISNDDELERMLGQAKGNVHNKDAAYQVPTLENQKKLYKLMATSIREFSQMTGHDWTLKWNPESVSSAILNAKQKAKS